ncbi:hypothetical protein RBH94_02290 [Aestuariibaculum sp. YM273]|uniref:hypothetical protein n=1 Tax=Aestuariibaculum sp. YM273 TaxID=3070659 RepID=UPI0027DDDE84|nr:hypothetical protein [Aestuariibaculum sp. YM273]WMI65997.1 hypothetical protein RBH94_02290 [Aestuariibaculum sp. YM273]
MNNLQCPACKKEYQEQLSICNNCNFPFNGSEKEKGIHIGRFISAKGVITDSDNSIEKSQQILFFITGLNVLFLIVGIWNSSYDIIDLILNGIISIIFLLCAIFIKKKPLLLTSIPLLLMIGINILNYILEPRSILNGILMKVAIIGSLIYSIYLIISSEKFKKQYSVRS